MVQSNEHNETVKEDAFFVGELVLKYLPASVNAFSKVTLEHYEFAKLIELASQRNAMTRHLERIPEEERLYYHNSHKGAQNRADLVIAPWSYKEILALEAENDLLLKALAQMEKQLQEKS
ncbi:hypothetical protein HCJ39_07150 [Listeria rocourtiae]|uniref:hypothetical protein n=1 Tax=Listeria rocourtiae TaxID=647910 RepID=UPI0016254FEE|nr:hypothetical protein [Listeria rocourtiae]MBC1604487.1 hypothetical protein [Listeria rocourtiae]